MWYVRYINRPIIIIIIKPYNDFVQDMTKTDWDPTAEARLNSHPTYSFHLLKNSLLNLDKNICAFLTEVTRLREVFSAAMTSVSVIVTNLSAFYKAEILGYRLVITFIKVA